MISQIRNHQMKSGKCYAMGCNQFIRLILMFSLLASACSIKQSVTYNNYTVQFWINNFEKNQFPVIETDTLYVYDEYFNARTFLISYKTLSEIAKFEQVDRLFEIDGFYGFFLGASSIDYLDTNYIVSRYLVSDNQWLNSAIEIYYTEYYKVIMIKFHGQNFSILDRILVKEGSLEKFILISQLIDGIFQDGLISPIR